jgi:Ca2+-binding RTX toxin-like protein
MRSPWTSLISVFGIVLAAVAMAEAAPAQGSYTCHDHQATVVGTDGSDTIVGTPERDVVVALGGDDSIEVFDGDDVVCGGSGNDSLKGGAGDDFLSGQGGFDVEFGSAGADTLKSTGELIWPGRGNDRVFGGNPGERDAVLFTGAGRGVHVDLALGRAYGQGHDKIHGVERVVGSSHDDTILGDWRINDLAGGETYEGGPERLGHDIIRGRGGIDFLFSVACGFSTKPCPQSTSPLVGDDQLYGGIGPDYLGVDGLDNRADGGKGEDHFFLRTGEASLHGGIGDDLFELRSGRATVEAGLGRDTLHFIGIETEVPAGPGLVDLSKGIATTPDVVAHVKEIENATGTSGDDRMIGNFAPNRFRAFSGNDVLRGRAGYDALYGGPDVDEAYGGLGRDLCVDAETAKSCERRR